MNPYKMLKKARNQLKKGDFGIIVRSLEKEIFNFRGNPDFYLILAICYIGLGNTKTAETYLESAANLSNPQDDEIQQAKAILNIARQKPERAISFWLDVLDKDPKNEMAQNGLETLRIHSQDSFKDWIKSEDFLSLYPDPSLRFTQKNQIKKNNLFNYRKRNFPLIKKFLGISIFAICLMAVIFSLSFIFQKIFSPHSTRQGIDVIMISPKDEVISSQTEEERKKEGKNPFRYTLTKNEILQLFSMIKDSFNKYEDNQAQMDINRLLLSNASDDIKRKALSLSQFITKPTFANFKKGPSFKDVIQNPDLYEGVYTRWKGKVVNLKEKENQIAFDFLLGYTDEKILEAIIFSIMTFDFFLENGMNIEVIAQIQKNSEHPPFILKIHSVHPLKT